MTASLLVIRVLGACSIQDRGRPGRMHEALARGGALVPELARQALRAAGASDDDATIEIQGQLVVRADTAAVVATHTGEVHPLAAGQALTISSEPKRVAYLALRGGIDAPVVLGSRSTQRSAGIGRPLRPGDIIRSARAGSALADRAPAGATSTATPYRTTGSDNTTIRIVPGPDREAFPPSALSTLLAHAYRVAPTSDRVGTRLVGTPIPRVSRADLVSRILAESGSVPPDSLVDATRPMVLGAIEVPGDGQPIVLGPEHPTTGGYPILAVIASVDRGRFFAIRLGGTVRFTLP